MLTVALLGNTADQAWRLTHQLRVPHRILEPGERPDGRVDVMVSLRFGPDEAALRPRLLHMPGAGTDAVTMGLLPDDCTVCNVFEHETPIAEYVMLAMLDWEINYSGMTRAFTAEGWSEAYRTRKPHGELAGRSVGLVGYGHIGRAIATRAAAFGMTVWAVASQARPTEPPLEWIAGPEWLDEMVSASDYVVVACPLTDATRGMIGADALTAMNPNGVLINVARGEIVDEEALYLALKEERIGGAILDAWFQYPKLFKDGPNGSVPPSRFPFDQLPTVRGTPHASAWTRALFERRYAVIMDNIRRFADGRPLLNVVHAPTVTPLRGRAGHALPH